MKELDDRAIRWVVELEEGLSRERQAEFDEWFSADPRDFAAFLKAQVEWDRQGRLARMLRPPTGPVDDDLLFNMTEIPR
jgi:ferric-dicitrate binding protein FerR (iron transport regulator)